MLIRFQVKQSGMIGYPQGKKGHVDIDLIWAAT